MAVDSTYTNKTVLIFGLGLNGGGLGMAQHFARLGAKVTVTDLKTREQLADSLVKLEKYSNITYHLGEHLDSDFIENDIIVRNPAIPPNNKYIEIAEKKGKEIIIELLYVLQKFPGFVIGITGTKGKSTVTTLIYEFLNSSPNNKGKVYLGGNLPHSKTIEVLEDATENDILVLELPSFQLEYIDHIKKSPQIAVLTNIYDDHVNWHGSLENYIRSKLNIFKYQTEKDVAVLNCDDKTTMPNLPKLKSKVVKISLGDEKALEIDISKTHLKGTHNKYNILQAIAVAKEMKVPLDAIKKVLSQFAGVEGRQQFIRELNGVKFYNDTTATNVKALIAAIDSFKTEYSKKIIMISGGVDKGLDYSDVKDVICSHLKALVLLDGTASQKMHDVLITMSQEQAVPIYKYFSSFADAIKKAYELALPGDIIILCPAAASFNMFANEFDRGKQFNDCVNSLG